MAVGHPALLADSGYAGLGEVHYELITCKKKPPMGALSQKDVEVNAKLHSDRVLVENFWPLESNIWDLGQSIQVLPQFA